MSTTMAAFYEGGGDYMHCISGCAIMGAALSIERLWALLIRHNIRPARFLQRIEAAVQAARGFSRRAASRADFGGAEPRESCSSTTTAAFHETQPRQNPRRKSTREKNHGPLAAELDRAIEQCNRAERAALAQVIRAGLRRGDCPQSAAMAMDEAALVAQPMIAGRTNVIRAVANIAMLIGLLGTVFGMIEGFHCVSIAPDDRAAGMARGIALAIHTTGYALIVAIPLNAVTIVLDAQSGKLRSELALCTGKLKRLLGGVRDSKAQPTWAATGPARGSAAGS